VFSFLVILQIAGQNKIPQTDWHCFIDSKFLKRLDGRAYKTMNILAVTGNETGKAVDIVRSVTA